MKACVVDIETTGLEAIGSGVLLVVCVKPVGVKKVITLRCDEMKCRPGKEKRLVQAAIRALSEFDMWIGHNVINFDYPWLRSRALQFGLPELPRPYLFDTMVAFRALKYKTVMNGFGKPSAGLGHVADFFQLKQEKTATYPNERWSIVWRDSAERAEAMADLVSHCEADVRMTEEAYNELLPRYLGAIKRAP